MLDLGRYLLGIAEVGLLAGAAWLGASALRRRLAPELGGLPAHLATAVLALALLVWAAELLGTLGWWKPIPYLLVVGLAGIALWALLGGWRRGGGVSSSTEPAEGRASTLQAPPSPRPQRGAAQGRPPHPDDRAPRTLNVATLIALAVATAALVHFAGGVRLRLDTGMTGFDSTWYHGPFAAGFFQSGSTFDLHFIAPQFLAWFYPANAEVFHGAGMLAFDRDLLSPLLNLGWFAGCLVAAWCIGRPFGVAPFSLALASLALSVPALADQAGEARNDVVGVFFLMAAIAIALNAAAARNPTVESEEEAGDDEESSEAPYGSRSPSLGVLALTGLAAGLAAGTKLNFLPPAAVLVAGMVLAGPPGGRWRASVVTALAALVGGGYWYLRNLVHSGNPLPWIEGVGPLSLPAPDQALGGREAHSVLGYLTDGTVWSEWFLPGLRDGLWILWPVLVGLALAGLLLCLAPRRSDRIEASIGDGKASLDSTPPDEESGHRPRPDGGETHPGGGAANSGGGEVDPEQGLADPGRGVIEPGGGGVGLGGATAGAASASADRVLVVAGLAGLAAAIAWLIAPTSASGPEAMPRGFESGLRYLAPALVLGLVLLPAAPALRERLASLVLKADLFPHTGNKSAFSRPRHLSAAVAIGLFALVVAVGYPVQRHYLESRYSNPSFTTPGLNATFAWARSLSNSRIATTSTRQYPLFGIDLSNRVEFVGEERPHGGFVAPSTCRAWRRLLNEGGYDYVVASRDRIEPGKPPYPQTARWTAGPGAKVVLREPPTIVFELNGELDPSVCR